MTSERDTLLTGLLALEHAERQLAEGDGERPEVEVLGAILRRLQRASRSLEEHPKLAYGLPGWAHAVVRELLLALSDDPASPWNRALEELMRRHGRTRAQELEELELLELLLADPVQMPELVRRALSEPTALAAAADATTAVAPGEMEDPLAADADWRHRRTDVVVYGAPSGRGAVIGLDLEFPHGAPGTPGAVPQSYDPAASALEDSFRTGVKQGHAAALALLNELGAPGKCMARLEMQPPVPRLLGALEPFRVRDRSAGLPVALATLREASRLTGTDLGPPKHASSGAFDEPSDDTPHWMLRDLSDQVAAGKGGVVARDGRSEKLIAPNANVDVVLPAFTLLEAAQLAWPRRWTEWVARLADDALVAKGYRVARGPSGLGRRHARADEPELVEVVPATSRRLRRLIAQAREPFAGILGGPANSGKSTIARQVGSGLAHEGWEVVWLAPPSTSTLTGEDLAAVVQRALLPTSTPVLVILEDLEPRFVDRRALDELILELVEEVDASVLAIARYDDPSGPQWRADGVTFQRAVSGARDLAEHADALIKANPWLRVPPPRRTAAVSASGGDLWLLEQLLHSAANESGDSPDDVGLGARFLADRFALLGASKQEEARRVAALSLAGTHTQRLRQLEPQELARLGGREEAFGWRIRSRWTARKIVESGRDAKPRPMSQQALEDTVGGLLRDELLPLFEDATIESDLRIGTVLAGVEGFSHSLVGVLIESQHEALVRWTERAYAPVLASFLERDAYLLSQSVRAAAVGNLWRATLMPKVPLELGDLAAVLSVLARFADYIEDDDHAAKLERMLRETLPRVLADDSAAAPGQRLQLLAAILRFKLERRRDVIQPNIVGFFRGVHGRKAGHYRVARTMVDLLLERREDWHRDSDVAEMVASGEDLSPGSIGFQGDPERTLLDTSEDLAELLVEPPPNASVGVWLGWLGLCNALRHNPDSRWGRPDWNELVDTAAEAVRAGIARATLDALWRAIAHLAKFDRGLCVRLLNRAELGPYLIERFASSGNFGQRARLLSTLANLHALTARALLYERNDPRHDLAVRFARQARTVDDVRGVGLFLKAVAAIDETYGSSRDGFAHRFAEELGESYLKTALRHDDRTAVVFHLIEGLSSANADYLDTALEAAAERIGNTITRVGRGWAPRLALTLGHQASGGKEFLQLLARNLDIDAQSRELSPHNPLRRRMRDSTDPQALLHFHRLAAALDPGDVPLARAFRDGFDAGWVQALARPRRPDMVAAMASAVTGTLLRAGEPQPAGLILTTLRDAGWDWIGECDRSRDPAWTEQTLGHLRQLDPRAAREVLAGLTEPAEPGVRGLSAKVLDAANEDPHMAASLIGTAARIARPSASALLEQLGRRRRRWHRFQDDLRYIQDPASQARAFRWLGMAGWEPDRATVERVWSERWSTGLRWLRNPRSIAQLIALFVAWPNGDHLTRSAVDAVSQGHVADRLREGALPDLEALPRLLATLRLTGGEEVAGELIDATLVASEFAQRAPVREGAALLREVTALGRIRAADELRSALRKRVEQEIAAWPVTDPSAHWLAIGTLAEGLGWDVVADLDVGPAPPATLHPTLVGPVLWGLGWLPPGSWREDVLSRAMEYARTGVGLSRPWAVAAALTVMSAQGRLAEARSWDVDWARAVHADAWILAPLMRRTLLDPELAAWTSQWGDALDARLAQFDSPWHATSPAAQEALEHARLWADRRNAAVPALSGRAREGD